MNHSRGFPSLFFSLFVWALWSIAVATATKAYPCFKDTHYGDRGVEVLYQAGLREGIRVSHIDPYALTGTQTKSHPHMLSSRRDLQCHTQTEPNKPERRLNIEVSLHRLNSVLLVLWATSSHTYACSTKMNHRKKWFAFIWRGFRVKQLLSWVQFSSWSATLPTVHSVVVLVSLGTLEGATVSTSSATSFRDHGNKAEQSAVTNH